MPAVGGVLTTPITFANSSLSLMSLPSHLLGGSKEGKGSDADDLTGSIIINAGVLVVGAVLWSLMKSCRLGRHGNVNMRRRAWVQSEAVRNYVIFLQHCRDMFVVLTVISAVFTVPRWGVSPITLGVLGGAVSTTKDVDANGLSVLCCETLLRGLVALAFVERLQRSIGVKRPLLRGRERDCIRRTLWLSDLPVWDHEAKQLFLFDDDDFVRVSRDLESAINQELRTTTLGLFTPAEMRVQVAPVVDKWYEVSLKLRNAEEHLEVILAYLQVHRTGIWGAMEQRYFERQCNRYTAEVMRLKVEHEIIQNGRKHMSGTAFITFQNPYHRDHFLQKKPKCWQFRDHAYFSFGVPPFASATLACTRAPHPSDVNWKNLHITRLEQSIRFLGLTILLFVCMVVLVTPVTISSQLKIIVPEINRHLEKAAKWLEYDGAVEALKTKSAEYAYNQLPPLLLVVINSLILPQCIYNISCASKPHRCSSVEVIQLHMNFFFLVLNAMVIPFLGLKSIDGLIAFANQSEGQDSSNLFMPTILKTLGQKLMDTPGIFALRYILNCSCMTNINSLLQIPQLLYRAYARWAAVTARESVEAEEVWVFAWGYWYAWTISIFTIGICMSSAVPSSLPCTALFFSLQHAVDRHNLMHKVYSHGPEIEAENLLAIRVLHYMRCIIAVWWCLMGCGFLISAKQMPESVWQMGPPMWCIEAAAVLFISLALALVTFSWWTHQSALHDNQFHNVDMAERGLSSSGGVFQRLIKHIDRILRCSCCRPAGGQYGAVSNADAMFDRMNSSGSEMSFQSHGNVPGIAMLKDSFDADGCEDENPVSSCLSWDARSVVLKPVEVCGPL